MEKEEIQKLEHKFDRPLTEGEAAEILNEEIIHRDDEDLYDDPDDNWIPAAMSRWMRNGQ
ncbi:hypothetical protein ACFQI7_22310 [Paenibacillus allorhizosphaerae]|uniref:Uncharacterized protein n=1 Tax=Paenibacillus allorhizosphaerae TaxID=2849866 RepID=A0ABM8VT40_9BACL|nr:hypothetical protein [Paenibacillus allorhizosphaerae]CAG7657342.1 hypothetical protein PAECIP111802_06699 [Paenibacillus allorhizosphaerae]